MFFEKHKTKNIFLIYLDDNSLVYENKENHISKKFQGLININLISILFSETSHSIILFFDNGGMFVIQIKYLECKKNIFFNRFYLAEIFDSAWTRIIYSDENSLNNNIERILKGTINLVNLKLKKLRILI